MKKEVIKVEACRPKIRALELYAHGTPFKPKTVESKLRYKRKDKHPKKDW